MSNPRQMAVCKHGNEVSLLPSYNFVRCKKCDDEADAEAKVTAEGSPGGERGGAGPADSGPEKAPGTYWETRPDGTQTLRTLRVVEAPAPGPQDEVAEIERIVEQHHRDEECRRDTCLDEKRNIYSIHRDRGILLAYIRRQPLSGGKGLTFEQLRPVIYNALLGYRNTIGEEALPMVMQDVADAILAAQTVDQPTHTK